MDGNTDTPGAPAKGLRPHFLFYLAPLLVLLAGLALTAFTANEITQYANEQSAALFQARHTAMVNALTEYRELEPDTQVFSSRFSSRIPEGASVRIDTLQTHSKTPVFESNTGHQAQPNRTLRSEISLGGQPWLVSSTPDRRWFQTRANKFTTPVWICGLAISVFGTVISGLTALRWRHQNTKTKAILHQQKNQRRELSNIQTEKRILRQALEDSEQRSRDLVSLSGSIVCELDESGLAGYVSARMADLLGFAPADLAGARIDSLIAQADQKGFEEALEAARQERQLQRLDLTLITADQAAMPATLRVLALHDTLHGFSGYRLTLQARH